MDDRHFIYDLEATTLFDDRLDLFGFIIGCTVVAKQVFQNVHRYVRTFFDKFREVFANNLAREMLVEQVV